MKKLILVLTLAASYVTLPLQANPTFITLSLFGDTVSSDGVTYTSATSTISGIEVAGGVVYPNEPTTVDLLSLGGAGDLRLNLTGLVTTSPGGGFAITLEDINGKGTSTTFNYNLFTGSSSTVSLPINNPQIGFDYNHVANWNWVSGASGNPVNASFTKLEVTAVPEPSTYVLLAISGLFLVVFARRRNAQA